MLLFPAQPFAERVPDDAYADEVAAAERLGLTTALVDVEALMESNTRRALRGVRAAEAEQTAIYRGWMLRPEVYAALYGALLEKQWRLINTPAQYRHTHYLPESYPLIAPHSPLTRWLPAQAAEDAGPADLINLLAPFGARAVIVKDYVKSRKHEWHDACFIPDASATEAALKVIQTFLDRQGSEFQGGVVLREFEAFMPLTQHSKSGMPLTREYRLFFAAGQIIGAYEYWEEGDYPGEAVPLELFKAVGKQIQSRFLTMDIAQRTDGVWRIMELGDGQVAGLPERADRDTFYAALGRLLRGSSPV
ncbi:ATP-grasp domain-containing protein [Deinococcus oregonensis]|uniref:ATP-grasp domain-containing protein n=1 Tax=Deinococcus oregonensis TaxID=1805970 RepID=A0ABV6B3T1_9DEIO